MGLTKKKKNIKFLLIVPYTYPDYSGSGRNAFNLGRYLNRKGIKVKVLTFNRQGRYKSYEIKDHLLIKRILYYNQNLFTKIFSLFLILPVYIKEICKHDLILIYGAHIIGYELIILLGKLLRKKVIFQSLLIGEDDIRTLLNRKCKILKLIYKFLFNRIDIYHAINKEFSRRYFNEYHMDKKILEIPQGVDTDIFKPVKSEQKKKIRMQLGLDQDVFIILTVGFLINRKGFAEVFSLLNTLNFQFNYIITGEYKFDNLHFLSYEKEKAEKLYNDGIMLLKDKLIFTGPVENVNEYFQASNVFLLNSSQEGLPNSLLEAMSVGMPVVTRNIPGIEDFIIYNQKNGFIFKDSSEMKDIIIQLYNNSDLRVKVGISARETIQKKASFNNVLNSYKGKLLFK